MCVCSLIFTSLSRSLPLYHCLSFHLSLYGRNGKTNNHQTIKLSFKSSALLLLAPMDLVGAPRPKTLTKNARTPNIPGTAIKKGGLSKNDTATSTRPPPRPDCSSAPPWSSNPTRSGGRRTTSRPRCSRAWSMGTREAAGGGGRGLRAHRRPDAGVVVPSTRPGRRARTVRPREGAWRRARGWTRASAAAREGPGWRGCPLRSRRPAPASCSSSCSSPSSGAAAVQRYQPPERRERVVVALAALGVVAAVLLPRFSRRNAPASVEQPVGRPGLPGAAARRLGPQRWTAAGPAVGSA